MLNTLFIMREILRFFLDILSRSLNMFACYNLCKMLFMSQVLFKMKFEVQDHFLIRTVYTTKASGKKKVYFQSYEAFPSVKYIYILYIHAFVSVNWKYIQTSKVMIVMANIVYQQIQLYMLL